MRYHQKSYHSIHPLERANGQNPGHPPQKAKRRQSIAKSGKIAFFLRILIGVSASAGFIQKALEHFGGMCCILAKSIGVKHIRFVASRSVERRRLEAVFCFAGRTGSERMGQFDEVCQRWLEQHIMEEKSPRRRELLQKGLSRGSVDLLRFDLVSRDWQPGSSLPGIRGAGFQQRLSLSRLCLLACSFEERMPGST